MAALCLGGVSDEETEWPAGTILAGRYRVHGELGRGGMGVVLRAWPITPSVQLRTDTPVALKLMLNAGGRIDQHRFQREARITAQLDPTGVCAVYDAGVLEDGTPYIAMELLEGEDLDDRLAREGTLDPTEAVDLLLAAIDILAEAHLAGLVHRDLKPSNLFIALTPLGPQLKVLDFGIVKVLRGEHQTSVLTRTGELLGSPAYMAPEQLLDSGKVDHRIDIWALGAVLYELLSGRPPFEAQTLVDLCQQVFTADVPRLPTPSPLEGVIARCLAKAPDDRFPNLAELARALAPHASPMGRAWAQRTLHRFGATTPRALTPLESADTLATASPFETASAAAATSLATSASTLAPASPYDGEAAEPRPRRRLWPALLATGLLAAGLGLGIFMGRRTDRPSRAEEDATDSDIQCAGDRCDGSLKLPHDAIEPFERRAAAERIARKTDPDAVLTTIIVSGLTVERKLSKSYRAETFIFVGAKMNLSVVVTPDGATVREQPTEKTDAPAPPAVPKRHCPYERVLTIVGERVPNQHWRPMVAVLMQADQTKTFYWTMYTGEQRQLKIDADCVVHNVN